jgi:flavin-dependent dehydrogenase
VSRRTLDESLAASAVASGCDLRVETTGILLPDNQDSGAEAPRRVSLQRADGRTATAHARAVIVADGLAHSSLRECPPFQGTAAVSSRIGIGGEAAAGAVEVEPGSITMAVSAQGYVGAVSVEQGRVNIAAAVEPALLRTAGGPAAAVRAILEDAGVRVFAPLESVSWMGTLPLTQRLAPVAARGIFVIGDAAGYVEPFTGEGISWALETARDASRLAQQAIVEWRPDLEQQWRRLYRQRIARRQRWCRVVALALRQPSVVRWGAAWVKREPGLAAPLMEHLNSVPAGDETWA